MKKISFALLWFSIPVLVALLPAVSAWGQTNPIDEMFKTFTGLELQVKIVMKDDTFSNNDFHDPDTHEVYGHDETRDKLNVTIEGTFRFKPYELPLTPPPGWPPGVPYPPVGGYCPPGVICPPTTPTYPRGPLLIPDPVNTPTPTINGSGNADSNGWWLVRSCKKDYPDVCTVFQPDRTSVWQYNTVDSAYAIGRPIENDQDGLVTDLTVKQQSEGAPVSYTFDLSPVGIGDYVKGSGSGTSTSCTYEEGCETTSYTIPEFGAGRGRSWTEFSHQYPKITGNLTIADGHATASGHLVKDYSFTSADGDLETGTAEVFYTIRAILSTDQALDQSELGCPDGKCKGNGGSSASGTGYGAPTWTVNMSNLNIFITDTPLWYRSPIGPPVEVTLSYNSKGPLTQFEPIGRKWQLNYESYLFSDQATGDVTITMPDGKRDVYTYNPTGFTAPYRVFNDLKITRQGGLFDGNDYELTFPDGTVYVYKVPAWSYRWAFLSEVRDPHSNKLTLYWEGQFPFGGVLKSITDALGRATVFTQDDNNRIASIRDPFGRTASFGYDPLGRLTQITDMGGYVTTFAYTDGVLPGDYSVIRRMVQGNNIWDFVYDTSGLTVTDNMGIEKFASTAEQGIADFQGANATAGESYGYTQAPARDGSKNKDVTAFRSPEGVSLEFTYDTKGNLLTDTLKAAGNDETAVFTYNAKGKVTSVWDAKQTGAVTTLIYDANGVDLIRLEDGLGAITASYNGTHDITSLTDRLGNTKTFDYNNYGQLVRTVQPVGNRNIQTDYVHNDNHQLIRIERAGAVVARYGYDDIGRIHSHTDANGYTLRYDYNNMDELLTITYPDNRTTEYVRTPGVPHQVKRVTDRANRTIEYTHNAHKQVTEILPLLPGAVHTRFLYYPAGQIREIIDPNGNSTQFEYDRDGRLTRKRFADNSSIRIAYANGRPSRFTNAREITTNYTYDKNGNVLSILYSDGTPGVTTIYDDHNRPVEIRDGLGTHHIAYDAASRPITIDGPWEDDTLAFGYDALGRKTSVTLGSGPAVTYGYDDLDRLIFLAGHGLTYSYVYQQGTSLLDKIVRADSSQTEYGYDPVMKRLEHFTNRDRTGSVLNEYAFEFDLLGQPVKETVTGGLALQFSDTGNEAYDYNNLNQAASFNGSAEVFAHDADGNMIRGLTGSGRPFEAAYDAENRLKSIQYTDGTGVVRRQEYLYGSGGFLGIRKSFANATLTGEQRFIRHGGKILQERNAANAVTRDYLWGIDQPGGVGALLALVQGGQTYQYYTNPRGDVTTVLDSAGTVAAAYAYDPFGVLLASSGTLQQPIRFSTKAYDEGTGLYDYGYRFYSPQLGRWLSRDPLAEKGSLNLYAFVLGNPLTHFDPFGAEGRDFWREQGLANQAAMDAAAKAALGDPPPPKGPGLWEQVQTGAADGFKWVGDKFKENPNFKGIVVDNAVDQAFESNKYTKVGKEVYEGVRDVKSLKEDYENRDAASGLSMLKTWIDRPCKAIPGVGWAVGYLFSTAIETIETAPGGVTAMRNPGMGSANQPKEPAQ